MMRPRLLLAEDHTLMAEGLRGILAKGYEVVGVVADGAAVGAAVARYQPDVLLLDLSLPNRPGMELLGELVPRYPKLRIIVVTMHVNRVLMEMAMRLGASGVKELGIVLYTKYLVPFEIASIILLVGLVGAVMLAKKRSGE